MRRMRGQALVFFALVIPMVLVPVGAYAVDASALATRAAHLQEVAALAAEQGAQQVDVDNLRQGGGFRVDSSAAAGVVTATVQATEPSASVTSVVVSATLVTVTLSERVPVPVNVLSRSEVTLAAQASARLTAGYDNPSSFLPLPTSTF